MGTSALRTTLCIALLLLILATWAIAWESAIIQQQRHVIHDLFSDQHKEGPPRKAPGMS